jgi:hypothetical protein
VAQLTVKERFENKFIPEPNSGCWIWTAYLYPNTGYGQFRMSSNPNDASTGAHRASWIIHCGDIPDGMIVCHRCDNRCCVNPDHLFLGSYSDNLMDASKKGRIQWKGKRDLGNFQRAETHHQAKLNWDAVNEIRSSREPDNFFVKKYGVSFPTIKRIRSFKTWKVESWPS